MSKSPKMEKVLDDFAKNIFNRSRQDNCCITCGSTKVNPNDFVDDLLRKEFGISHMCQECQNDTFKEDLSNMTDEHDCESIIAPNGIDCYCRICGTTLG